MEWSRQLLLLLCATAVVAANELGDITEETREDKMAPPSLLRVIPKNDSWTVSKLVIEGSLITLNEEDRLALATYPNLVELHLNGNLVTAIAAKYFCVVPHLRVLSLSRNIISSLDPEAFLQLNNLTELDLSHNRLTSLPQTLFRGLHSLQVLKLQENSWNCFCSLLTPIRELKEANVKFGGPQPVCASPDQQAQKDLLTATADCYQSGSRSFTTRESSCSSTGLQVTRSSSQDGNIHKDQTPVLGNTWKFTVCVAALALTTSMLIVFGIKGPSWYKLFHNYRHRRLERGEDEENNTVSNNLPTRRFHQTFKFSQGNGHDEEEEEYFEDPYVQRDLRDAEAR